MTEREELIKDLEVEVEMLRTCTDEEYSIAKCIESLHEAIEKREI